MCLAFNKIIILQLAFIAVSSLGCNNIINEKKAFNAAINDKHHAVTILNNSHTESVFAMNVNNKIFQSVDEIIIHIDNMPNEFNEEPPERKAWRFVVENTGHINISSKNRALHSPLLLINSSGVGLCDDLAAILCAIWKQQKFNARIWTLNGHVVPEVFTDNKWKMYDPSFAVYYMNKENNMVAGVEELSKSPELIYNPLFKLPPNYNRPFIQDARKYSEDIADLYSSTIDNVISNWHEESIHIGDFKIHLPKSAFIEFPVLNKDSILLKRHLRKVHLNCFIKYVLPEGFSGKLKIPFLICQINGKGFITLGGKKYDMENDKLNDMLKKFDNYYQTASFYNTTEKTEIYCLLNPVIFNRTGIDSISIKGVNLENIETKVFENNDFSLYSSVEKRITLSSWQYYDYFNSKKGILKLPIFSQKEIDLTKEVISESIRLIIMSMDSLPLSERKNKADLLAQRWDTAYPLFKGIKLKKKLSLDKDPVYFAYILGILENN